MFNDIGIKILFPEYSGVDITQRSDHMEMPSKGYIDQLLKSHGWKSSSSKLVLIENIVLLRAMVSPIPVTTIAPSASVNKL